MKAAEEWGVGAHRAEGGCGHWRAGEDGRESGRWGWIEKGTAVQEGVDGGVEYRHGVKARTEEAEEEKRQDGDERRCWLGQREQPRALASRPGPVRALLTALRGLSAPICETGMGTHAPLSPPPLLVRRGGCWQ